MTDDCCNIPASPTLGMYYPDGIIIYGVKLNTNNDFATIYAGHKMALQIQLNKGGVLSSKKQYSIAAGYGYSYQGHCYRFSDIRIFVITGPADEPAIGCGFDTITSALLNAPTPEAPYSMWRIGAATQLLELTSNYSDAQTLILDANLPGKRAPNTYAVGMNVAHRGGRISRE